MQNLLKEALCEGLKMVRIEDHLSRPTYGTASTQPFGWVLKTSAFIKGRVKRNAPEEAFLKIELPGGSSVDKNIIEEALKRGLSSIEWGCLVETTLFDIVDLEVHYLFGRKPEIKFIETR